MALGLYRGHWHMPILLVLLCMMLTIAADLVSELRSGLEQPRPRAANEVGSSPDGLRVGEFQSQRKDMRGMIFVIARIEVVAGKRDAFLQEFHRLVPSVLAEEGCIEYGPTIDAATDIDAQRSSGETVVTIMEKWESVAALNAHLAAPHMAEYRERVKDLVVDVQLQILQPA